MVPTQIPGSSRIIISLCGSSGEVLPVSRPPTQEKVQYSNWTLICNLDIVLISSVVSIMTRKGQKEKKLWVQKTLKQFYSLKLCGKFSSISIET